MGEMIEGNASNFPEEFFIPDDSEAPTGAAVNPGFEALADRTAWLRGHLTALASVDFIANDDVVAPDGSTHAILEGWGGGGGGGAGVDSSGNADVGLASSGGGGGGGAIRRMCVVPVVAGETYDVTIGNGGAGGTSSVAGTAGGDTKFTHTTTALATFAGADGGESGFKDSFNVNYGGGAIASYAFSLGGSPIDLGLSSLPIKESSIFKHSHRCTTPQAGGMGISQNFSASNPVIQQAARGNPSEWGTVGGNGGNAGATTGASFLGGGCGGGGGAGPGGNGGNGGNGTAVNESGASANATSGASAAPNSGAGGGGGGSAGGAATAGGLKGNGGNGGSGFLRVTFIRRGGV